MQGVEIADSGADWLIQIYILVTKIQPGTVTGYALSEVVVQRSEPSQLVRSIAQMAVKLGVDKRCQPWLDLATTATKGVSWSFEGQALRTGPLDDLRKQIEGLAAAFDTQQLEPARKLWEKRTAP